MERGQGPALFPGILPRVFMERWIKTLLNITFWTGSVGRATLPGTQVVSMDVNAEQQLMLPLANESFEEHHQAVGDKSLIAAQQGF